MSTLHSILADVVVTVHFGFILFVVVGLLAVILGAALGWTWVRNFWFRLAHLLAIGVVVVQALLGVRCPLTILEMHLRDRAGEATYAGSFIGHWIHRLIIYEVSPRDLALYYCLFGAAVAATLVFVPPRWPRRTG